MSSKNWLSETLYISLDAVLEIHKQQLKEFGGSNGIRNQAGLESAVEAPKATFGGDDLYSTIFAESPAFIDGNKRTALDVALTFLAINGYEIENEEMQLFDAMIPIAEKKMSKEDLAKSFENLTTK